MVAIKTEGRLVDKVDLLSVDELTRIAGQNFSSDELQDPSIEQLGQLLANRAHPNT